MSIMQSFVEISRFLHNDTVFDNTHPATYMFKICPPLSILKGNDIVVVKSQWNVCEREKHLIIYDVSIVVIDRREKYHHMMT